MKIKLWHTQFVRYGFVGIASTLVHVAMAFTLTNLVGLPLVFANVGAFFTAVFVSYFGNARWSFGVKEGVQSLGRFFGASALTLTLIIFISIWVTDAGWPPYTGILMTAVTIPIVGFSLQKLWVFNR